MNPSDEVGKDNDVPPEGPSGKKVRKGPKPKSADAAGGGESLGDTGKTGIPSEAFSKEAPGDTVGGRYEIVALIGEGSMGVLYRAKDPKLGREVALKRLRGEEDAARKGIARFLQEARAIAALNHRNIATIYDLGEDDKGPFIVMEYLRGGDLRSSIAKQGKIELEGALSILKGVGQGLAYAHNRGILHRNVKPANILLAEDGTPKLVDFGLALMPGESEIPKTGDTAGAWAYLSPEQTSDARHVDQRSDIYALAKTLYHMVTGKVPDSIDWDIVPPEIRPALEKALQPASEDRPSSVKEFLTELGYPSSVIGSPLAPGTVLPGTCLNCGAQNPQGTRFCQSCGAGLFERCPRCGLEGPMGARHCGSCGVNVSSYKEAKRALSIAEEHLKKSEYAEAEKEARRALRLGCLTDELKEILKKAATSKQQLDELRAEAMAFIEKERYEDAEKAIRRALELDPSQEELQRLLKELPAKIQEHEVHAALTEAGKALEEKRYPVALERCEWVLEQQADNEEARELKTRAEKLREDRRARVAQAREALEASHFDEASEQLKRLEEDYPWDDEIKKLLQEAATREEETLEGLRAQAMDLIEKEQYEEAEKPLRDVLELDPSDKELQRLLQELPAKIQQREVRAALTEASKALEEKRYPLVLERCKWVLGQQADNEEARELQSRAEKLQEDHRVRVSQAREALEASRFDEASEQLRSLEEEYPWDGEIKKLLQEAATRKKGKLEGLRAQAMALIEKERYEEAEKPLRDALELDPSQGELQRLLKELPAKIQQREVRAALTEAGKALGEKRYPVALERCEWVLGQQPDNEEAGVLRLHAEKLRTDHQSRLQRARSSLDDSLLHKALEQLSELEKDYPWDDEVGKLREAGTRKKNEFDELRAQAMVLIKNEQYEDATAPLRNALKLDPSQGDLEALLEELPGRIRERDIRRALTEARNALANKRYPEALERCDSVLQQQPENKEAADLRARAEKLRENHESRLERASKSLEAPGVSELKKAVEELRGLEKEYPWDKKTRRLQEEATTRRESTFRQLHDTAMEHVEKGEFEDAEEPLRDALELDPSQKKLERLLKELPARELDRKVRLALDEARKALREKRYSVAIEHGNWVLSNRRRNKEAADIVARAKSLQKRAKPVAIFGDYEAVSRHARTVGATVWTARLMGSASPETFAVKAFDSSDSAWDEEQIAIERDAFAESARTQQKVAAAEGLHWAPVLDCGTGDKPFFATKYYRRSAQGLLDRRSPLSPRGLHAIVSGVVRGLEELKRACGRPHGNLKPSNVLIGGEGRITPGKVVLTDPLPDSRLDPEAAETSDLQAIGTLVYQLVLRRPFRLMGSWPIPRSEAWSALGKSGETWRRLCDRLLDPDRARSRCSLGTVAEALKAIEKPRKVRTYALAGAGAVAIAAASVLFIVWLLGRWGKTDARTWESLCLAHKEWFVGFLEDTKDSGRRNRWSSDPHLASVLAKLNEVKPERHDPRQIAKRTGVSYQNLATAPSKEAKSKAGREKTKEALSIVLQIKKLLQEWPVQDELSQRAKEFEGCGLRERSQHVTSLVKGLTPGKRGYPPQDISERIDRAMAVAGRLDSPEISGRCVEIVGLRENIEGTREPWRTRVIASLDASFQADTRSGETPFGKEDLDDLQGRLPGLVANAKQVADHSDAIARGRKEVEGYDKSVLANLDDCLLGEIATAVDPNIRGNLQNFADKMSRLAKTVSGISEVCGGIEPYRKTINAEAKIWGSKVLTQFGQYVRAEAGSAMDLEALKTTLEGIASVAGNLVTFLEGDWREKVDCELFIKEGEVSPGGVPTKDTFVSWVQEAKHYEKFAKDPRDSWVAKEMRRELESARLTADQKRRLDKLATEMDKLERLPGVVKYKDTIEGAMAAMEPGMRELHFEIFFADNWKRLCSEYEEWFAAFFEDTKDSRRREQWQKDAHLKGVLAVRDKVNPERHDPRQIAKRPEASYQELATSPSVEAKSREGSEKTKEAWGIVQEVKTLLIRLPIKTDLSQRAKGFEGYGLRDRSRHLASLAEGLAPGKTGYPPPDISQRIDNVIPVAERLKASWDKVSGKCAEIGRLRETIRGEGEKWRDTLVASFDGSFAADTRPRQDPCSEEDLTNLQGKLEELAVHAEQIRQRCQTIHDERETIKRCGEKMLAGFDTCLVGKVAVGVSPSRQENLKGLAEMLGQVTGTVSEIARLCTSIRAGQQTIEDGGTVQDQGKTWKSKVLTKFEGYVDAEVSSVAPEDARRALEELKGRLGEVESTAGKLIGFVKGDWPTEVARELFIDEGEVALPDTGVPVKETFEAWLEQAKNYYKLKRDPRASWTPERRVEAIGKAIAALPPTDSRREKNEGSLKEVEAQIRTVRALPGIERSKGQIQGTVQTVDLRLDQMEFDLFFAEKWQAVCLAYEGWFEKFLADTADLARQERWQKDAYLKAVLAVRAKVRPEHHPRKIANRSDASLLELAKNPPEEAKSSDGRDRTKAALELIRDIESRFRSGDWPASKSVAALSETWKERKWAKPAAHLESLVEAVKPGPKLVAAVDEILTFEEQTRREIESRWTTIDGDRKVIKASGSKVLGGFDNYIEAEAGSATNLEGLKTRLEEVGGVAGNLVTFLEGDWQEKVDRGLFIKEGEVSPAGVPTEDTFVSWVKAAKLYEKFAKDPRDSWAAKEMRRELESAQLTEDQKRRLDKLATAMGKLETLPGVVKYKETIEGAMASVEPGIRDLHFEVFFAENWKRLCSEYEQWFAAFFEGTRDSGRQAQWQKDAYLRAVLTVRDTVKPERHDPRQIAARPDASYQELAATTPDEVKSREGPEKTKEALGAIAAIKSYFQPGKWKTLETVAALSGEWQRREWRRPAAHLNSLVEAVKPGPKLVAAVDGILAFQEQTRKEIESRWEGIESDREVIEASGDEVLKKFGEFLTAETKSAPGEGTQKDVEALRKKLDELEKLSKDAAAFVRGPWKDRVDQQWFKKEVSDRLAQTGRPLTAQLLRETWLADDAVVKGFYRLDEDPRDSWALDTDDAKNLRETLEKRHAQRTVTEQEYTRLSNELDRLKEAITAVRSLPALAMKKTEIEEGMKKAEEAYALLLPQIPERQPFGFEAFFAKLAADFHDRAAFRKHFRNPGDADALRGRGIPGSTPHSLELLRPKGPDIQPKRRDENGNLVFDVLFRARFEDRSFIRGTTYVEKVSQEWTIEQGSGPDEGQIVKVEERPVPPDTPEISWRPKTPDSLKKKLLWPRDTGKLATTEDEFEVWNSGGGELRYSIIYDHVSWLNCRPEGGSSGGEHQKKPVTVTFTPTGPEPEEREGMIAVVAPEARITLALIPVSLTVLNDEAGFDFKKWFWDSYAKAFPLREDFLAQYSNPDRDATWYLQAVDDSDLTPHSISEDDFSFIPMPDENSAAVYEVAFKPLWRLPGGGIFLPRKPLHQVWLLDPNGEKKIREVR